MTSEISNEGISSGGGPTLTFRVKTTFSNSTPTVESEGRSKDGGDVDSNDPIVKDEDSDAEL